MDLEGLGFIKCVGTCKAKAGRGGVRPLPKPQAAPSGSSDGKRPCAIENSDSDSDSEDKQLLGRPLHKAAAGTGSVREPSGPDGCAVSSSPTEIEYKRPFKARAVVESSDDDEANELLTHAPRRHVAAKSFASTDSARSTPTPGHAASALPADEAPRVRVLDSEAMPHGARLCISDGSVLDFGTGTNWNRDRTAVVNAANVGGVGGGGVDGAFVDRGGEALALDRRALPYLSDSSSNRIPEGGARATGPNEYGTLYAKTVIHAVGPSYPWDGDEFPEHDALLRSAYIEAMNLARDRKIEYLGFSLLSAGVFAGNQDLLTILRIGFDAISACTYAGLREVHMVGFSWKERQHLARLLSEHRATAQPGKRKNLDGSGTGSVHETQQRQSCEKPTRPPPSPPAAAASLGLNTSSPIPDVSSAVDVKRPQTQRQSTGKSSKMKLKKKTSSAIVDRHQQQDEQAPVAFEGTSGPTQSSQKRKASAAASAQSPNKRQVTSAAPDKRKPVDRIKKGTGQSKAKTAAKRKMETAANQKGQQRLAFAAPLKEGDKAELVSTSCVDIFRTTKDGARKNPELSAPSLQDLLAQKLANELDADRRRSAIESETPLMVAPTFSPAMLAELDEEPAGSDTDSDLDGGDDTELTEIDVWLGTFEVQRTREWRTGEISMADALAEQKKRLGKLHRWRVRHFTSQLRSGNGIAGDAKKFVSQRDVVMALTDKGTASALLTQVERQDMLNEFAALRDAVAAYRGEANSPAGSSASGAAAMQHFVLTEDMVSPQVLVDWAIKVASLRQSQIRYATVGKSYSSWLAEELRAQQNQHAPSPPATDGASAVGGSYNPSASASPASSVSPPEKVPSPPAHQGSTDAQSAVRHSIGENDGGGSKATLGGPSSFPSPVRPGALSSFEEEEQLHQETSSDGAAAAKCLPVCVHPSV